MATNNIKKIGTNEPMIQQSQGNAWEVMKPFVHFGIKATGLLAGALVSIIKSIPKPMAHDEPKRKNTRIIKI